MLFIIKDSTIRDEGRLALGLFILIIISTLCFLNIIFYVFVLYTIETKFMQEQMERWKLLKRIMNIYKKTNIAFIVFEVLLFVYTWFYNLVLL